MRDRASMREARLLKYQIARAWSRSVKKCRVSSALASIPLMTFSMDLRRFCNPPSSVLETTSFSTRLEGFTFSMKDTLLGRLQMRGVPNQDNSDALVT